MLTLNLTEIILFGIILVLFVICLILLKKNFSLKETIKNDRAISRSQLQLEDRFKNISNEILLKNHENFLSLAKETFDKVLSVEKSEFDRKQNGFVNLIRPIQETLSHFDTQVSQIEKSRIDAYSELRQQIRDLMLYQQEVQKETSALNQALSNPAITGRWGEMQLKRVVELTGMTNYCDFVEQKQGEDSRLRPDMVIKLPGNRNIIVDSKAPTDAYMQAINTGDEKHLLEHIKNLKLHIKKLSQKNYWDLFSPTPEFVIMFLPGESFFSSAIKKDSSLMEFGVQEKVIISTPLTLIAILKAISFSWQQEAIAKNAKEIGKVGKDMYHQLLKLIESSKNFAKKLQKNIEEYDKITSFIDKKILPTSNRLKNLGMEITDEDKENLELIESMESKND